MIESNPYWYNIRPGLETDDFSAVAGKWLCFGPKEELHLYLELLDALVSESVFRAVKVARKDPDTDPFPHKECVVCVYTSSQADEIELVRKKLKEIGLVPTSWKSEAETDRDWDSTGKLQLEAEIVKKKKALRARAVGAVSDPASFDVFLCHNSADKPTIREICASLELHGLRPWLDESQLIPGRPWQEVLESEIETIRSSAVFVGPDGIGPWQDREMRAFLSEFVRRRLPVIPVLLPGLTSLPKLPLFLKEFTWVDLRSGLSNEGLARLRWGITGERQNART